MLAVAICDDAILDCCSLEREIKDILEDMGVPYTIKQFHQGEDLLKAVEGFDIIFLDIMMRGLDGMRTARLLRKSSFDRMIVFVSSSRKFVMEAFEVEAFHYLTKPVDRLKLENTLKRACSKSERSLEEFIIISKDRQNKKIWLKDIFYFEVRGRIVYVHSRNGIFDYYGQIGELERNLSSRGFFRCHKSFLINLSCVDTYDHEAVTLDNGERIVIAKRRYEAFGSKFLDHVKENGGHGKCRQRLQ